MMVALIQIDVLHGVEGCEADSFRYNKVVLFVKKEMGRDWGLSLHNFVEYAWVLFQHGTVI